MNNELNRLTGTVMLETMWESHNSDLLDLISPFVLYSVGKKYLPNDEIKISFVKKEMETFGFQNVPDSVIKKIMSRKKDIYQRRDKKYYLIKNVDSELVELDSRKDECSNKIQVISEQIAKYLSEHCKGRRKIMKDEALQYIQEFFSRNGLYIGTETLIDRGLSPKENEIDYYIGRYIFEKKDNQDVEYKYILDLVKVIFCKQLSIFNLKI